MKSMATGLRIIALVVGVLVLGTVGLTQTVDQAALEHISQSNHLGRQAVSNPFSLLDLSRIQWSHSYSVSYLSGGGYSNTVGLFQTSMLYEFSPKLSLDLRVGLAHTGNIFDADDRSTSVLPGFTLDYHPSNKFRMSLSVQTYNGYVNPYGGYNSLWHRPFGP